MNLSEFEVETDWFGKRVLDLMEIVTPSATDYLNKMEVNGGNYVQIAAIKASLDKEIEVEKSEFESWKAKWKQRNAKALGKKLGKARGASNTDLEEAVQAVPCYKEMHQAILDLEGKSKVLYATLVAIKDNADILCEMARNDRSGLLLERKGKATRRGRALEGQGKKRLEEATEEVEGE